MKKKFWLPFGEVGAAYRDLMRSPLAELADFLLAFWVGMIAGLLGAVIFTDTPGLKVWTTFPLLFVGYYGFSLMVRIARDLQAP